MGADPDPAAEAHELRRDLAELQGHLASLEQAERRFALLETLSPVGIFRTDAAGDCRYVNARWSAISGLSDEQARGNGWTAAIHPDDRERVTETWYRCAREQLRVQLEYRFMRPDGQVTWVLGQAVAERDAEGRLLGYVGTVTDITDRKRAEAQAAAHLGRIEGLNRISKALQVSMDSTEVMQAVLAQVLDLFQADRAFLLYPCDPQAPEVSVPYEVTRPKVAGAQAQGYRAPIDPSSAGLFRAVLDATRPVVAHPDPEAADAPEWVRRYPARSIMAIAIRPRLGMPWLMGIHQVSHRREWSAEEQDLLRDIALRMGDAFSHMRLFEELKQSEAKLRAVIDNATDSIYVKDRAHRVLLANPVTERLLAARPFPPEVKERIWQDDEHVMATGQTLTIEERVPIAGQGERVFSTTKFPYRDADGAIVGVVGISRDLTDVRQTQEEVERRTRELEQVKELDRLKSQFVNSVTHELRTPLTSILGYAEFLEDEIGGPLTDEQSAFVHQIWSGARRLEGLLNDLLDFARMEAGTFTLRHVRLDLRQKIHEVLASLRPQATDASVRLEIDLPETPLDVCLDADRIGQVVLNLVGNAIKFTPAGGRVAVRAGRVEGRVRLEVQDSGEGIAEADQPRLFQRFSQLASGLAKGSGAGLGLSISKALIDAHGGRIGVESRPGAGSTFWFELPAEAPGC